MCSENDQPVAEEKSELSSAKETSPSQWDTMAACLDNLTATTRAWNAMLSEMYILEDVLARSMQKLTQSLTALAEVLQQPEQ